MKFDTILNKIKKIEQRLVNIKNKFHKFETKLEDLERRLYKLETVCEKFQEVVILKPQADVIKVLNTKIDILEKFIQNYETEVTMKESYDNHLNILIDPIKEDKNQAWENCDKTEKSSKTSYK